MAEHVRLSGRGRRRFLTGHPWVYADDLNGTRPGRGALVELVGPDQERLGWGLHSADSKIAVRAISRAEPEPDEDFWSRRLDEAVALRARARLLDPAGACRVLHGDADGFPGLVVDRYANTLVVQSGAQASEELVPFVAAELPRRLAPHVAIAAVVERSDASVRRLEGLEPRTGVLSGTLPESLDVVEGGVTYSVDVLGGHKTGAYLDQRDNRTRVAQECEGANVLDAFSYDGLFGLRAARAGAREVLCLDQSREAGERLVATAERNGLADRVQFERANATRALKELSGAGREFDVVVVDPPAFARNRRELPGAARGYRDLARRGLELTVEGGLLVIASCSYAMSPAGFVEILGRASADAGRRAFLEHLAGAGVDHPALVTLPESAYLKCAFLRVGGRA